MGRGAKRVVDMSAEILAYHREREFTPARAVAAPSAPAARPTRRTIGIGVSHVRHGVRVRIALRGRASQPHAWHTLANVHLHSRDEAELLVRVLRAGALAVPGVHIAALEESKDHGARPPGVALLAAGVEPGDLG